MDYAPNYRKERPPSFNVPLLMSLKSIAPKFMRDLHCIWCGRPFVSVSDDVAMVSDSYPALDSMTVQQRGPTGHVCKSGYCKQKYRMEFAA